MKKLIYFHCIICFILASCQDKTNSVPFPDATFTVEINDSNIATFSFKLNEGELYTIDFGDGSSKIDSFSAFMNSSNVLLNHEYKTDGQFLIALSIKSIAGIDKKTLTINASNATIADFSYEILENGRVKFKNLSKNDKGYKWRIEDNFSYSNMGYYFYTSTEKDPIITFDLNGDYQINLSAEGDFYHLDTEKQKQKIINIKSAKSEMMFSGYYKGEKKNIILDGSQFYFSCFFGGGEFDKYGLYQKIMVVKNSQTLILGDIIFSKFYPLPHSIPFTPRKEDTFSNLKKYLNPINDPDIIEVTEETLDPLFYNNTEQFYPKAFWVKYKVKNETLDGELKVRIMVYGLK